MPQATPREQEIVTHVVTSKSFDGIDPAEILSIVNRYDTVEQTREIARDYANRARIALEPFGDSPAKETLEVALDFVLDRDR
jgi:geranylgeranyl pyrophosphate synthase